MAVVDSVPVAICAATRMVDGTARKATDWGDESTPAVKYRSCAKMHGFISGNGHARQAQRPRRDKQRARALYRGYAAACARMGKPIEPETDQQAVNLFGTSPAYLAAFKLLIEYGDHELTFAALTGEIPVLTAAKRVRKSVKLTKAYTAADADARKALGEHVGVDVIWDEVVVPSL
jgi:hypothetical protein